MKQYQTYEDIQHMYFYINDLQSTKKKNGSLSRKRIGVLSIGFKGDDVSIAGSICSGEDQFNSKIGKSISDGRLILKNRNKNRVMSFKCHSIPKILEILAYLFPEIRKHNPLLEINNFQDYDFLLKKIITK